MGRFLSGPSARHLLVRPDRVGVSRISVSALAFVCYGISGKGITLLFLQGNCNLRLICKKNINKKQHHFFQKCIKYRQAYTVIALTVEYGQLTASHRWHNSLRDR